MKTTNLIDYFERIGYDWNEDLKLLTSICMLTKTRPNKEKKSGDMSYGSEQCFLVKAIAKHIAAECFFEIGTGRGTACYSVALEDTIEEIITIDIISHFQKKNEAIAYMAAQLSNHDIYQLVEGQEKEKISFKHRSEVPLIMQEQEGNVDLAFIDGDHTTAHIIKQDFEICDRLVRKGGIIIFDDYHPTKFAVKGVVDEVLKNNPSYEAELICFHGHLFDKERKTQDNGIVVIKK